MTDPSISQNNMDSPDAMDPDIVPDPPDLNINNNNSEPKYLASSSSIQASTNKRKLIPIRHLDSSKSARPKKSNVDLPNSSAPKVERYTTKHLPPYKVVIQPLSDDDNSTKDLIPLLVGNY